MLVVNCTTEASGYLRAELLANEFSDGEIRLNCVKKTGTPQYIRRGWGLGFKSRLDRHKPIANGSFRGQPTPRHVNHRPPSMKITGEMGFNEVFYDGLQVGAHASASSRMRLHAGSKRTR